MPSEIKTPNIGLNQWQGNEYVKRQDFVDDNNKIDNEIGKIKKQMESISTDASSITYDNSVSELESDNVQDAIDEVNAKANANETSISSLKNKVDNGQNHKICEDNGVCKDITGEDANNISVCGYYKGQNIVNAPSNEWYFIETMVHNNSYQVQTAIKLREPTNRFTRIRNTDGWQPWREL